MNLRLIFRRISSSVMALGLMGLSACSLSQQEASQQVRIQVSPSAFRSVRPSQSGFAMQTGMYLVSVEGPGIPLMPIPGAPCASIGMGPSVFVSYTAGNDPVDLWVPAGPDRVVKVFLVTLSAGIEFGTPESAMAPFSGQSAMEYFLPAGTGVPPRAVVTSASVYGRAIIPNLTGEQSVDVVKSEVPELLDCSGGGVVPVGPPAISYSHISAGVNLSLTEYGPYSPTGSLKFWRSEDSTQQWLFRLRGNIHNFAAGAVSLDPNLSYSLSSGGQTSVSSALGAISVNDNGNLGFEDRYTVDPPAAGMDSSSYDHGFSLSISGSPTTILTRPISVDWSPSPLPGMGVTQPELMSGGTYRILVKNASANNLYLKAVRPDAVFEDVNVSASRIFTVVQNPSGTGASIPNCPIGTQPEMAMNSTGCYLFFSDSGTASTSLRLEIEVDDRTGRVPGDPSDFRTAQFVFSHNSGAPTASSRFLGVTAIASGDLFTCAIRDTSGVGRVWCWGSNVYGQLGVDPTSVTYSTIPLQVPGLAGNLLAIAAGGDHACAVLRPAPVDGNQHDDEVWCWGRAIEGQLGVSQDATISYLPVKALLPVSADGSFHVLQVVAGATHTCALLEQSGARAVRCWGGNSYGQLGANWTGSASPMLINISNLPTSGTISNLFSGRDHTCLVMTGISGPYPNGLYCWGRNDTLQLQGTNTAPVFTPQLLGSFTVSNVLSLGAGFGHTCSVTVGGGQSRAQCWGSNDSGQSGAPASTLPVSVTLVSYSSSIAVTPIAVTAGLSHSCAIFASSLTSPSGGVKCWGAGSYGQLGDGGTDGFALPQEVTGLGTSSSGVIQVSAGLAHTCAIVQEVAGTSLSNSVRCWGNNTSGQLGFASSSAFSLVPGELQTAP